jgi:hypothetical protein
VARLLEAAERIARVARRPDDLVALKRVVDIAWTAAAAEVDDAGSGAELGRRRERALAAIGHPLHETGCTASTHL